MKGKNLTTRSIQASLLRLRRTPTWILMETAPQLLGAHFTLFAVKCRQAGCTMALDSSLKEALVLGWVLPPPCDDPCPGSAPSFPGHYCGNTKVWQRSLSTGYPIGGLSLLGMEGMNDLWDRPPKVERSLANHLIPSIGAASLAATAPRLLHKSDRFSAGLWERSYRSSAQAAQALERIYPPNSLFGLVGHRDGLCPVGWQTH